MSKDGNNPFASPKSAPAHQQSGQGQLASLGDRFLGALVDGLILLIPGFGIAFVFGMVLAMSGFDPDSLVFRMISSVVGFFIGFGLFLIVNGYLLANKGQTIGKIVMKTQIVSENGEKVPFLPLILKRYLPLYIASAVPIVGGLYSLVDAAMIFRESRKCLHDEIAGTKVISLK